MVFVLRLALACIALGSLALFLAHPWWLPAQASAQAPALDHALTMALGLLGGLFVAGQLLLAFVFGRPGSDVSAPGWRGNWRWETAWTVAITALFFWFNVSGGALWSRMMSSEKQFHAVRVEVTGVQFQWYFRYPGADNAFGRVDARKYARPEEGNPLGLEPGDPAGEDDVVSSSLVLPVGRPVDLILRAQDVIHSVFIPAMRLKQDAVPGMETHMRFTPTQTGGFEMVCSQLCGLGHYRMKAAVRVVSEQEFTEWTKSHDPRSARNPLK